MLHELPPHAAAITLDIDDTFDALRGHQQLSLLNARYNERCFLPTHIYEGPSGKPVAVILSEGKTPPIGLFPCRGRGTEIP